MEYGPGGSRINRRRSALVSEQVFLSKKHSLPFRGLRRLDGLEVVDEWLPNGGCFCVLDTLLFIVTVDFSYKGEHERGMVGGEVRPELFEIH